MHIIAACHKVGLEPTGSQDPYALRRAARCINEILFARRYNFNMSDTMKEACRINDVDAETLAKILEFLRQRLLMQLKERGYSHELATLGVNTAGDVPYQALRLIETFNAVKGEEWFSALANSAVRVKNILQKNAEAVPDVEPLEGLMTVEAERKLWVEVKRLDARVREAVKVYDWAGLAKMLAELSPVIAAFFDGVMVMDKDEAVRNNRLALLKKCNELLMTAGDLSVMA